LCTADLGRAGSIGRTNADSEGFQDISDGKSLEATAEANSGIQAVVVTPSKKSKAGSSNMRNSTRSKATAKKSKTADENQTWIYVLNMHKTMFTKFDTHATAEKFKNRLLQHNPLLTQSIFIEEMANDEEAKNFLSLIDHVGQSTTNRMIHCGDGTMPHGEDFAADAVLAPAPAQNGDAAIALTDAPVQNLNMVNNAVHLDEEVPFRPEVSMKSRPTPSGLLQSPQMSAFAAAMIGSGTSIIVMRWRLPRCKFHVYAYKLMEREEQYWSHKPTMWMLAAEAEKVASIFSEHENMTLHQAMNRCSAAGIRAIPNGDNTILQFKTKRSGKLIDQYLLYGLVHESKSNEDIGLLIKRFVGYCQRPEVRHAYYITVKEKMQSPPISEDTDQGGKYWAKLTAGSRNIVYREKQHLSEVFLDDDIKDIVHLAYETTYAAVQFWPPDVRDFAFGTPSGVS
jgi:hypothetical protein